MPKLTVPKTKIKDISTLLDGRKITELAHIMEIPYTQLYQFNREGANPSVLSLDNLAEGLCRLHGRKISILDLFDVPLKKISKTKKKND